MILPRLLVTLAALGAVLPAPHAAAQRLTVSAASSVADVVADVGRAWEAGGGAGVTINAGGSNVLARQIAAGAPVDVFFSADHAQMDAARRSGRIVEGTVRDVLSNRLVVIVPPGVSRVTLEPADLGSDAIRRIALGNPDSVPAGVYARQWLERLGLWTPLAQKVVPTLTVRAALATVRAGRADAGVVFATDARSAPEVRVVYTVPETDAPAIRYPAAVVRGAREAEAGRFLAFLESPDARAVFEAAGFLVLEP